MPLDTNPVFWRCWEQLGHAIAVRACIDYSRERKKEAKSGAYDRNAYRMYELFFCSKYFGRICPKFDGHELYERLESGGWQIVRRQHHYTYKTVYDIKERHPYKERKFNRGRPRKFL